MERLLSGAIILLCVSIVGLAVAGGVLNYSPVPFWDMWNGSVESVLRLNSGDLSVLWAQHNEHRIILSRILLWLDMELFAGRSVFLLLVNYVLVACGAIIFWRFLVRLNSEQVPGRTIHLAAFVITAWMYLWTQEENLTWGFQGQFFLAQLLPLFAFFALARAAGTGRAENGWFAVACLAGVVSVGSMANGLLALPLLAIGALVLRYHISRIAVPATLAVICFAVYLHGYYRPSGHASLTGSLIHNPIGIIIYTCGYLGSPFYRVLGTGLPAMLISGGAGGMMVLLSALAAWRQLRGRVVDPDIVALLLFLAYVGGTAFLTAGGRISLGMESVGNGRYTTPAVMAWVALFCIYSRPMLALFVRPGATRLAALALVLGSCIIVANFQRQALQPDVGVLHSRAVAALALELGVQDDQYIESVYPDPAIALGIARQAADRNMSVFGMERYMDISSKIGHPAELPETPACTGHIDTTEPVEGADGVLRVHGWLFNDGTKRRADSVRLVNAEGKLVGYAIAGAPRPDLSTAIDTKAERAGFDGYALVSALGEPLKVYGDDPANCHFAGVLPPP